MTLDLSGASWRKSSRSDGHAQNCVMVAHVPGFGALRDSKLGDDSPVLVVSADKMTSFIDAVKGDRFVA